MSKLSILKEELQKLGKSLSSVFAELPTPQEASLNVSSVEVGGKVATFPPTSTDDTFNDASCGVGNSANTLDNDLPSFCNSSFNIDNLLICFVLKIYAVEHISNVLYLTDNILNHSIIII